MNKGIVIIVEILFLKNNNKIANKKNKIYSQILINFFISKHPSLFKYNIPNISFQLHLCYTKKGW